MAEKTEFVVEVVTLGDVHKHPNADSLSITQVNGSPVVFKTGDFREGQKVVYVPVDALVPVSHPEFAFLKTSRTDGRHRIRAMRLRGVFSMGLLVPVPKDGVESLNITRYKPPEELRLESMEARSSHAAAARKVKSRVNMPVYGLDSLRKYGHVLREFEEVVITEKIHGSSARYVFTGGRLWVGSHRSMRGCTRHRFAEWLERAKLKWKSFLGRPHRAHTLESVGDIWWEAAEKYDLKARLAKFPDLILYGEIYGSGVQDLHYDAAPDTRRFRAFDLFDVRANAFLSWDAFLETIHTMGLTNDAVPVLYRGPWTEALKSMAEGTSTLASHIREGVVIKPVMERMDPLVGRVALKLVGEGYHLRKEKP